MILFTVALSKWVKLTRNALKIGLNLCFVVGYVSAQSCKYVAYNCYNHHCFPQKKLSYYERKTLQ